MAGGSESEFRLRLAEGFLAEATQDFELQRWRSCVDNGQLAVENAAKAVLALLGPVGRTHSPAPLIREALQGGAFPESAHAAIEAIVECAELLGPDIHIRSDYGDEAGGLTPWDLFDNVDAKQALTWADETVSLARGLVSPDGPAVPTDADSVSPST